VGGFYDFPPIKVACQDFCQDFVSAFYALFLALLKRKRAF
jgi:hypothetical protein